MRLFVSASPFLALLPLRAFDDASLLGIRPNLFMCFRKPRVAWLVLVSLVLSGTHLLCPCSLSSLYCPSVHLSISHRFFPLSCQRQIPYPHAVAPRSSVLLLLAPDISGGVPSLRGLSTAPVRMTHSESTHQDLARLFNFTFMLVILWLRFAHTYQDLISTKSEAVFMVDAILQFPG